MKIKERKLYFKYFENFSKTRIIRNLLNLVTESSFVVFYLMPVSGAEARFYWIGKSESGESKYRLLQE